MAENSLVSLQQHSLVVADTGDFETLRTFSPTDATTNPSLVFKTLSNPSYKPLLEDSLAELKKLALPVEQKVAHGLDWLTVRLGKEILARIPGYVSTEVDARLSFDFKKSVEKARSLIALYEKEGVDRDRVLIKLASTYEGIEASKVLAKEGIKANMTLLFNFHQAVACMQAQVFLISPFVGRVLDWYQAKENKTFSPAEDPGVLLVQKIYHYYKQHQSATIVMAASFRSVGEILALAGCDRLTISPNFLADLQAASNPVKKALPISNFAVEPNLPMLSEPELRWHINQDAMATEKLAEGIRNFASDCIKLENLLRTNLEL